MQKEKLKKDFLTKQDNYLFQDLQAVQGLKQKKDYLYQQEQEKLID